MTITYDDINENYHMLELIKAHIYYHRDKTDR